MSYLAVEFAVLNSLLFALLAIVGKFYGTWSYEERKSRALRIALESNHIGIFSGFSSTKLYDVDVLCSSDQEGTLESMKIPLSPSRTLGADGDELMRHITQSIVWTDKEEIMKMPLSPQRFSGADGNKMIRHITPTISWTSRKGPPMLLLVVHVFISSYFALKIFYEFLGSWNNIPILFMMISCFFHIGIATFSIERSKKLHSFCTCFGYFFLTAGSGLGMVDVWEQLLTSTKIVACTGLSLYAVFATIGTVVEKLAILEWLAYIIYGLMPLMMALTINPTDPYFP